jgi:hypothetical protein
VVMAHPVRKTAHRDGAPDAAFGRETDSVKDRRVRSQKTFPLVPAAAGERGMKEKR